MKKFLIALMVLLLALTVVACGGTPDVGGDDQTNPPEEHIHAYSEETVPSTCIEAGKVITKCACGDVQSETELPVADHVLSAIDCEKDTVCTVCGVVIAEKTGHTVAATEIVTAATCSSAGKEKGACSTCGKIIEVETPIAGHKANKDSVWTLADGGYSTTCVSCNQTVTFKEDTPLLSLTFEEDFETEVAKYPAFKAVTKKGKINIVDDIDGDKAGMLSVAWVDVLDNSAIRALGSYVVTFDFMLTKDVAAGAEPSVFSILTNFADGDNNGAGSTSWGYAFKFNEDADKLCTIAVKTDFSKHTDENSIAVEKNTKYTVKLIYSEGADTLEVFINGKYIGKSGGAISKFPDGTQVSLRLGDGPASGFVFDNVKLCGIK